MGNKVSLEEEMINLRIVSKQMARSAKKCEKNEKVALEKLKKVRKKKREREEKLRSSLSRRRRRRRERRVRELSLVVERTACNTRVHTDRPHSLLTLLVRSFSTL